MLQKYKLPFKTFHKLGPWVFLWCSKAHYNIIIKSTISFKSKDIGEMVKIIVYRIKKYFLTKQSVSMFHV